MNIYQIFLKSFYSYIYIYNSLSEDPSLLSKRRNIVLKD